jgi:hypothetical protein
MKWRAFKWANNPVMELIVHFIESIQNVLFFASFAFTNSEKTFIFLAQLTFRPSCFKNENTHCQRTSFILKGNKFNNKKHKKSLLILYCHYHHPEATRSRPGAPGLDPEPTSSRPGNHPDTTRSRPGSHPESTRRRHPEPALGPPGALPEPTRSTRTHPEATSGADPEPRSRPEALPKPTQTLPGADTETTRSRAGNQPEPTRKPPGADPEATIVGITLPGKL